ncbi:hypothetical protein LWI29_019121 [Acer saccharum]|uniref:Uncharacterized protein n=1 Tax=Acer saccharum TaxID=4024 RepID=A0AA39V9L4_ACESA|nr:hypothetical protein LWI29_019121 [Acer saccharum]
MKKRPTASLKETNAAEVVAKGAAEEVIVDDPAVHSKWGDEQGIYTLVIPSDPSIPTAIALEDVGRGTDAGDVSRNSGESLFIETWRPYAPSCSIPPTQAPSQAGEASGRALFQVLHLPLFWRT